jgi:H+/Cl- antiporter ClcA
MTDTTPPPTPGDALVGRVILFVGTLALAALLAIAVLAYAERPIPDVLENIGVAAVTGLVALLAGRTQR